MRKILITGGSRGIGAACVKKFAEEGAAVCFVYKSSHDEAEKLAKETGAAPICADLSDKNQAADAVKKAAGIMGGIDVLVNNAGVCHFSLFTDETDAQFDEIISANLADMVCIADTSASCVVVSGSIAVVSCRCCFLVKISAIFENGIFPLEKTAEPIR